MYLSLLKYPDTDSPQRPVPTTVLDNHSAGLFDMRDDSTLGTDSSSIVVISPL